MTSSARSPDAPVAVLTVAGSDSGAGAGIQADLKTFAALGVYGASAITAVTAQNTLGVRSVHVIPPAVVAEQIASVLDDLPVLAVKTGMLANAPTVEVVAATLAQYPDLPLVVDPVTHAKGGDALIDPAGVDAIRERLIPRCTVVTPNLAEAAALTGLRIDDDAGMRAAAFRLLEMGAPAVVIKGGHRAGDANDLFVDAHRSVWLPSERIVTRCTHGTGCTYSAAIAAHLACGHELLDAVRQAKTYLTAAMRAGYVIGAGYSPVNHMYALQAESRPALERIAR